VYFINSLNAIQKFCYDISMGSEDGEDIFEPTTGNERLHEISNNNIVRAVNIATSKYLTVRSTKFPHQIS
jgi:hypothetical protein